MYLFDFFHIIAIDFYKDFINDEKQRKYHEMATKRYVTGDSLCSNPGNIGTLHRKHYIL